MKSYSDSIHNLVYNTDASHLFQNDAIEVVIPETKEELIDSVKTAVKENKRIICRAGWTNLVGNCLPEEWMLVIDISKLNKIIAINENSVLLEPWITNDQLNEELKAHNKIFPVVLWSHAWAEIWWMIATNWAWMRAIKYWKMENRVEELEVLTVSQDKEVKVENLKYPDGKDFLWSEGHLWIVLQVKLRTIDIPQKSSMEFKEFDSISLALEFVESVKNKNESSLSALEIINPQVAEYLSLNKKYYVLVEYENPEIWAIKDEKEIRDIRDKRDACYAVTIAAWYDQIEDPEIHSNYEEFFKWFEEKNIPIFWHIGIWVLHPHFKSSQSDLKDEMYKMVQKLWWNVSWEHWIWKKKIEYLTKEILEQKKLIKDKRDPNNVFWF